MKLIRIQFLPIVVFIFIVVLLSIIQLQVEPPVLIAERFIKYAGWFEIILIGLYGAFLVKKMENPALAARWRIISWSVFSLFFFMQLILGVLVSEKFLMSGKLHLPVPAMILAGPIYRNQISFMTLLFLSTILLTGPAWCSQLCYFGAIDGLFSYSPAGKRKIKNKSAIKNTILLTVISTALILRIIKMDAVVSTIAGIGFGVLGLLIILLFSRKKGKMVQCILYCPVGTLVNYLKYINPFRIKIDTNCNLCHTCTSVCKYDALTLNDLKQKKPGITCTLCGDCIDSCKLKSIRYKLFQLNPTISRKIYLFLTVSLHAVFLALAKI